MPSPASEGTVIAGKYRVDRVLGEGGMGLVVAATDLALDRRVAIKFLLPDYAENQEAAERFVREARAAVKIQSEHVARVIDVARLEDGSPYMVMEYLEGTDLAGLIALRGRVAVEDAVLYILQACEAIAEAHAAGIVHRDLKPANLFLAHRADGSESVKVLDFGISKTLSGTGSDFSLTKTSSMMGSPLYMSPEQMRSARDVDARTDLWALGAILYEALAGRPPFMADGMPQLCAKILAEHPDPLTAVRADVPPGLDAIVQRCLSKDPAGRPPTVADFAIALLEFAPKRGRQSVERITRVMRAAGLTQSTISSAPSLPPPAPTPAAAAGPAQPVSGVALTHASWGATSDPLAARGSKKGIVFGAVGVLLVASAAAGVLALRRGSATADEARQAPSAPPAASLTAATTPAVAATPAAPAVAASTLPAPAAPAAVTPAEKPAAPAEDKPARARSDDDRARDKPREKTEPPPEKPAEKPPEKPVATAEPPPQPTAPPPGGKFGGRK